MKYLDQINAFFRLCEMEKMPTNIQVIWLQLSAINNKCMWADWFRVDTERLMWLTGISSKTTLIRNREKLIQMGLIEYRKGKKGKPSQYHIVKLYDEKGFKNWTENATENATKSDTLNATESDTENATKNATENATHNRHKTKDIRLKEKNNIKKESFGEFVSLTQDEHQKLVSEYGQTAVRRMITILDNYKGQWGRKYKSDYRAILNWVVKRAKEEYPQDFRQADDDGLELPF